MAATIMIVDDSPTMLMSIEGILTKAGLGVVKAANGEQALETLKTGTKPSLVITDLNMGAMDGIELIRRVRKLPGLQFTPILMLTTESQQDKRNEAKSAGATGWIVKPVDATALIKVIRQLVPGA
ncbi:MULTISPECIES: response regulator [unclassified Methylobacterium]|jgi:two-component system, chemotaxis family, chemotaxis protein CheY|uniref:response regulator n=1 Tax=unclassified Methylobacterium TaxID=2615210 RepID=UPI0006FD14C9|nr:MULTISPECIES: response regulator [unclassified Methylobacterium]KQO51249.1 two-component system sensor histidine kinase/response regulator [Methylobacterium sp. Leaf86]KQO98006.1 two-component system sensor histidine kinase/response regulator [Methylobacterium sp. Leaf91]MBO1022315.1 response regulator [Methylobacterium sp. SD274]